MKWSNYFITAVLLTIITTTTSLVAGSGMGRLAHAAGKTPIHAFNNLTPKQKIIVGIAAAGATGVVGSKLYRHFNGNTNAKKSIIPTWLHNTPLKKSACYLGAAACLATTIPSTAANACNMFIPSGLHPVQKAAYTLYNQITNPPSLHEYLTHVVVIGGVLAVREAMIVWWNNSIWPKP
ncbi:hypothetical protein FJ365_04400 [Candidatus Dependentiae bacterium]|nr:hypothetical protein [Candidatus Dependentiae bacterium]